MDVTILNDLDFPVHEEIMQTKSVIEIPATMQKAIIRSDTNQPLATVGKKYTIVKHQDVVKSIRDAISKANIRGQNVELVLKRKESKQRIKHHILI